MTWPATLAAMALVAAAAPVAAVDLPLSTPPAHMSPRATYLGRCGGCHGVDGHSADGLVPDLKDAAGYFLCDETTRAYAARLPNVAFAQISDADMAAMMNFVMFDLGGRSAPAGARAYTADEMGRLRRQPLTIPDLKAYRRAVVAEAIARCQAPNHLRTEYDPPSAPR